MAAMAFVELVPGECVQTCILSLLYVIHSIIFGRRRKIADRIDLSPYN
jgi:hypothetical protein